MSYDKYLIYKKQYSIDNGVTWIDTYPLETTVSGESIGSYETLDECEGSGYTSTDYFRIIPLEHIIFGYYNGTASIGNLPFVFSKDSGNTWSTVGWGQARDGYLGEEIWVKGIPSLLNDGNIGSIKVWGRYNVEGNIMSLLHGDYFGGRTSLENRRQCFSGFFSGQTGLESAENLILPSTILTQECYANMFSGCTSLVTAPKELCAENLIDATYCYQSMFNGCTSLTTAPIINAKLLSRGCCGNMFYGCTSLRRAPKLEAKKLVAFCYYGMFSGCTNLNYIECLAVNPRDKSGAFEENEFSTHFWMSNVPGNGVFVKYNSVPVSTWGRGEDGIPNGWTVQDCT